MGHLLTGKAHLVPLIDRLNRYPVGLVDNQQLREILALLFSAEEAAIAAHFPLTEATCAELAALTGFAAHELLPKLERMADKGLVAETDRWNDRRRLVERGLSHRIDSND